MKKYFLLTTIFLIFITTIVFGQNVKVYTGDKTQAKFRSDVPSFVGYVPDAIVVKFKSDVVPTLQSQLLTSGKTGNKAIDALNIKYRVRRLQQMFPGASERYYRGRTVQLSGYYRIKFDAAQQDIEKVAARYQALPEIISAEPIGIHTVSAIPNDSHFSDQWHLDQSNDHDIDAPEAWDIETGSEDVIVSVFDTGVRYFHKDLGGSSASYADPTNVDGNMWINWAEKNGVEGVDDDNNGFVDDWIGWDFVDDASDPPIYPGYPGEDVDDPDNDPRDFNGHGTHCAGNIGAINNNGYATAAPSGGWGGDGNGVKVMACRIGWSVDIFGAGVMELGLVRMDFAAQAFYYAADNGAKIVSCSWGSSNSGGLGDAIDYFLASGGLIFKAAGNDGNDSADYMCGRSDIISVAATDENDCAASFTNYGSWVDISAPGVGIWSLYHDHNDPENDYVASIDGTSMATPLAASVAALIWSQNSGWSASQVEQQLYDSADDIDDLPCNSSFVGLLGAGRINAYNAVSGGTPPPPSISIDDVAADEGDSGTTDFVFTVTLSKTSDSEVRVDYATADGTATAGDDYVATSGTLVFAAGEVSKTITVQVNGDEAVESDETFFVNLSNPVNATISDDQGQGTIQNDDEELTLSINDVAQDEGDSGTTDFVFTVTLSSSSSQEVRVDYATADGTATAGDDYVATSGTLVFAAGEVSKTITVQVNGDEAVESDETFFVNLSNPVNATISDDQGQGTIQNDDVELTLSINDVAQDEGNSGTTDFVFTVTLSSSSSQEVRVDYATADGTATAGDDYVATSGTLVFAAGEVSKTITVQVNGDEDVESDETFFVNLSNPVNATISDDQGQGTIQNDDVEKSLSIDDVAQDEGNSGTTDFVFTVTLSASSSQEVRVDYATADGSATAGDDYVATSGTLVFAAGEVSKTITVQVNGDEDVESDETFFVNLSNPVNATISDDQGQGTIQNDDASGNFMHVNDVVVTQVYVFGRVSYGKVEVQIVDQNGNPVEGATVEGEWTEGASGTESFTTGADGWGSEQTGYGWRIDRYCFQVTNVTKTDWTYDTDANVETWACSDGSSGLNATLPKPESDAKMIGDLEKELGEDVVFSYPNPFNSSTTITFYLPKPGNVTVEIYNVLGEKIATLLNREMAAGLNLVSWNGTNASGAVVSAGHYFFRIQYPDGQAVIKRMLLLK